MNILNNPYFTSKTTVTNPYIDTITFTPSQPDSLPRQMQTKILFERWSYFSNAIPIILSRGEGKPSEFYNQIMKEVEANPNKYNCTKQELFNAYKIVYGVLKVMISEYKRGRISERVFQNGVTLLNEKFFEDLSNGKLNRAYFIDGMKKASSALSKYL